jgi:hypothetical protein
VNREKVLVSSDEMLVEMNHGSQSPITTSLVPDVTVRLDQQNLQTLTNRKCSIRDPDRFSNCKEISHDENMWAELAVLTQSHLASAKWSAQNLGTGIEL